MRTLPLTAQPDEVLYGVVTEVEFEGNVRRLLVIPRLGEIEIPNEAEIVVKVDRESKELEAGDLVEITFPADIFPDSENIAVDDTVMISREVEKEIELLYKTYVLGVEELFAEFDHIHFEIYNQESVVFGEMRRAPINVIKLSTSPILNKQKENGN